MNIVMIMNDVTCNAGSSLTRFILHKSDCVYSRNRPDPLLFLAFPLSPCAIAGLLLN